MFYRFFPITSSKFFVFVQLIYYHRYLSSARLLLFFCMCFCFRAMSDESQWIVYTEYSFKLHLKKTIHSPGIYDYIFHVRVMFIFFSCKAFLGSPFRMRAFLITLFSRIFILPLFSMSSCEHQWLSFYDEFIYSNGISVKFYFDYNRHDKWTRYWIEWESNMENSSIQRVQCQLELNSYTSSDWIQYGMRAII